MATNATDVNKTFKLMKTITIMSIIGSVTIVLVAIGVFAISIDSLSKKAYFITYDGTYVGMEKENRQVTIYEVKNHIRKFMGLTFSHDARTFKNRIEAGLKLIAKEDGKAIYKDFTTANVYDNYLKYHSRTSLKIDSITVDMKTIPWNAHVYAIQYTIFDQQEVALPIAMYFDIDETFRSDENTDGLILKNYKYINYQPVAEEDNGRVEEQIVDDQVAQ